MKMDDEPYLDADALELQQKTGTEVQRASRGNRTPSRLVKDRSIPAYGAVYITSFDLALSWPAVLQAVTAK